MRGANNEIHIPHGPRVERSHSFNFHSILDLSSYISYIHSEQLYQSAGSLEESDSENHLKNPSPEKPLAAMSGFNENGEDYRLTSEIAVTSKDPESKDDKDKPKNGDPMKKGKGDEKDIPEIVSRCPRKLMDGGVKADES